MYKDLTACLDEVKSNPATRGLITAEYDNYLSNQLQISAGKDSAGETVYRPYYVAAKFLEQIFAHQSLKEADDVKFTGLVVPIASLLKQQSSLDQALGLTLPPGFEAIAQEESIPAVKRYATGSRTTRVNP